MSDDLYAVWASNPSIGGKTLVSSYADQEQAVRRYQGLREAQEANPFHGSVWIERNGERWEPDHV